MSYRLEPGSTLGRYLLHTLAAEGAEAEVWSAEVVDPTGHSRRVALKIYRQSPSAEMTPEKRFGELLRHPHLVDIIEAGQADGRQFLALEWVAGGTLADVMERAPLSPRAVADLGVQLSEALAHLHSRGLLHRDVKPHNVMFTAEGIAKLSDLGLAVRLDEQVEGDDRGAPGFRSPEHETGQILDGSADVWSLGATLYCALTGERRWQAHDVGDSAELYLQVSSGCAATPALRDILVSMVAPLASDRPTATEARNLLAALTHLPGIPLKHSLSSTGDAAIPAENEALGNLRERDNAFIGRADLLEELEAILRDRGGVFSLTGPAGVGKTRLANHLARKLELQGGSWAVDLTHINSPEALCSAIAETMSITLSGPDPSEALGVALGYRPPIVLLLDQADECVDWLAACVAPWATAAPRVRVVITSRVDPEVVYGLPTPVPPLPPAEQADLFTQRAERHGWAGKDNDGVERLLQFTGGLPLAIELAAAQTDRLSPSAIAQELEELGGTRGPDSGMAQAIAQSWNRLAPEQRQTLMQVAVFEGGFELDSAEEVVVTDGDHWILDTIQDLVERSLVVPEDGRLFMLAPIRSFALTMLQDNPEIWRGTRDRHAMHFAAWRARLEDSVQQSVDHAQLGLEIANVHAALAHSHAQKVLDQARDLMLASWYYFSIRADSLSNNVRRLRWFLDTPELDEATRALVLSYLASSLVHSGRFDEAEETIHAAASIADPRSQAHFQYTHSHASLHFRRGQLAEARPLAARAVDIARELGRDDLLLRSLLNHAAIGISMGAAAEFETINREVAELGRAIGAHRTASSAMSNMGAMYWNLGRYEEAGQCFAEALSMFDDVSRVRNGPEMKINMASYYQKIGDMQAAVELTREALGDAYKAGVPHTIGVAQTHLAEVCLKMGETDEASALARDAVQSLQSARIPVLLAMAHQIKGRVATRFGHFAEARSDLLTAQEILENAGYNQQGAANLCELAECALFEANWPDLNTWLERAQAVADSLGPGLAAPILDRIAEIRDQQAQRKADSTS